MNDKVSIILPCYQAEKYIGDMIEDILRQTYENWELIIVSNGGGKAPNYMSLIRS